MTIFHLFICVISICCAIHGIQIRGIQNDTLENRIVALEKLVEKLENRIKNGTIVQKKVCLFGGVQRHFQQYFSYIVVVSFISGGNPSTQRKPLICRKSLTNFITQCCALRPDRDSYSQYQWCKALITQVVVNPTTIQSRPRRPLLKRRYMCCAN